MFGSNLRNIIYSSIFLLGACENKVRRDHQVEGDSVIYTEDFSRGSKFTIHEEFLDSNSDGSVEVYVLSCPEQLDKTRIFISKKFADEICGSFGGDYSSIRIDFKSKFTKGLELIRPSVMEVRTQEYVNRRNRLVNLRDK